MHALIIAAVIGALVGLGFYFLRDDSCYVIMKRVKAGSYEVCYLKGSDLYCPMDMNRVVAVAEKDHCVGFEPLPPPEETESE